MKFLGVESFLALTCTVAHLVIFAICVEPIPHVGFEPITNQLTIDHFTTELHVFTTCLSQYNLNNFTLHPGNNDDPTIYFKFLYLSLHNLRFRESSFSKPIAILMPENKEQLVNSVRCCRNASWEIRVRSGGHSYEGTSTVAASGTPFVIIDLINLDRVSVDLKAQVAWVEGGATLGQVYYAIASSSKEYGFSAGSCPTVGVGGHIGGGGFGLLSRKYGLAADNVVDVLIVDANGRLLDRETMGEEVFWAIRGGGGGTWGIVYAWKIQLLKVPPTVTGFIVSRPGAKEYVAKLVHKWQEVAPKLVDEFYLSMFVGAGLPKAKTIGISSTFNGFYLGSKTEAISILTKIFPELNISQTDCQEMSWIESVLYFSGLGNGTSSISELSNRFLQEKMYFKAKSDYVKSPMPYDAIRFAIEILEKQPKGYVILDPYGGAMEKISSEFIAFPHRKGNLFAIQYRVEWKEEDNEKSRMYMDWIRGFYNSMTPYVSSAPRAAYVNYMDLDLGVMNLLQEEEEEGGPSSDAVERARLWGEKYFLANYDRLVEAKTLVDPLNIFRNAQGIPPMSKDSVRADT